MTKQLYSLYVINHHEKLLFLPESLAKIPEMTVVFGSAREVTKVRKIPRGKDGIFLTRALMEALAIPDIPLKLNVIVSGSECLIGPVVGIFTAGFKNFSQAPLGQRTFYFAKLLANAQSAGVLPILFGVQHIQWEEGLVNGFLYDRKKDRWLTLLVPLPNVVYDRIPNRRIEQLDSIQNLKQKLQKEYGIPWFNPGFFNKWELYQRLAKNEAIRSFLPETILFQNKHDLFEMLKKYDHLYLKWVSGSHGNGVYEIKKDKNGRWNCYFRDEEGRIHSFFATDKASLIRHLNSDVTKGQYIIQQGIDLIKHKGNPVDFRLHMNKRQDGTWTVTALAAKVSSEHSPTTHLVSGGEIKTIEEIFLDTENRHTAIKRLRETALLVSETLDKLSSGFIGEIGLDIGIDQKGNTWLFEANAKPGRSIYSHPSFQKLERINHLFLFEYATALATTMFTSPEEIYRQIESRESIVI